MTEYFFDVMNVHAKIHHDDKTEEHMFHNAKSLERVMKALFHKRSVPRDSDGKVTLVITFERLKP